jgi:hypothetical protein
MNVNSFAFSIADKYDALTPTHISMHRCPQRFRRVERLTAAK